MPDLESPSCFLHSCCWVTMCSFWKCLLYSSGTQVHESLSNVVDWLPVLLCPLSCLSLVLGCPLFSQSVSRIWLWSQWPAGAVKSSHYFVPSYLVISSGAFIHVSECNLFISTWMFLLQISTLWSTWGHTYELNEGSTVSQTGDEL